MDCPVNKLINILKQLPPVYLLCKVALHKHNPLARFLSGVVDLYEEIILQLTHHAVDANQFYTTVAVL